MSARKTSPRRSHRDILFKSHMYLEASELAVARQWLGEIIALTHIALDICEDRER
jgi:hypothetical protein